MRPWINKTAEFIVLKAKKCRGELQGGLEETLKEDYGVCKFWISVWTSMVDKKEINKHHVIVISVSGHQGPLSKII